ncbi:MAG: hypothetical protein ACTS6G_04520, partial [Candidatus Hodgkinia cicadicola]
AAGTIIESIPDQQIMISASGFTAATNAIHYLASPEASLAISLAVQQLPTTIPQGKTKLAEVQTITPASVLTSEAKAETTSEPALAGKTPSAVASAETKVSTAPQLSALSLNQSAPTSTKLKPKPSKGRRLQNKTSPSAPKQNLLPSSVTTSAVSPQQTLNCRRSTSPLAAIVQSAEDEPPKAPSFEDR